MSFIEGMPWPNLLAVFASGLTGALLAGDFILVNKFGKSTILISNF